MGYYTAQMLPDFDMHMYYHIRASLIDRLLLREPRLSHIRAKRTQREALDGWELGWEDLASAPRHPSTA